MGLDYYRNLYNNCMYSSIAHALYILDAPFFSYEQSWDLNNYCFHYGLSRGTISFDPDNKIVAGAMRMERSKRIGLYPELLVATDFYSKASEKVRYLASTEAIQYLYDRVDDYEGPIITAAFWIEDNQLIMGERESDFYLHGGEFLKILSLDLFEVKDYWKEQYELSDRLFFLTNKIFEDVCNGEKSICLGKDYADLINLEGYSEMQESLMEIGVTLKII